MIVLLVPAAVDLSAGSAVLLSKVSRQGVSTPAPSTSARPSSPF
jgi:hypothetical protein